MGVYADTHLLGIPRTNRSFCSKRIWTLMEDFPLANDAVEHYNIYIYSVWLI